MTENVLEFALFFNFKTRKTRGRIIHFEFSYYTSFFAELSISKSFCLSLPYFHRYILILLLPSFMFQYPKALIVFRRLKSFNAGNLKILSFSLHLILTLISKSTNPASYFKNSKCLKQNPFLFKCLFFNPTQKSILKNRTPMLL